MNKPTNPHDLDVQIVEVKSLLSLAKDNPFVIISLQERLKEKELDSEGGNQKKNKPKIYISGAISGLCSATCKMDFEQTAECLAKLGYEPVNPFDNRLPEGSAWEQHMAVDLELLRGCDAIFMKFGWDESRGSRLEHAFAELLGIKIVYWNE